EGLRELVRTSKDTRKDLIEIHFRDFGSHSLDILVWIFFRVPDWTAENVARHTFNMEVLRLAKRLGVEFAYPTQTLELRRVDPLEEPPPAIAADAAREEGIEAAKSVRSAPTLD
ncbi:MAG: mechanosensitive ion channel family protein, partial [Planctomycetota bacterium]